MINEALYGISEPIPPQRVFDIVVGTSTGGSESWLAGSVCRMY